MSQKTCIVCNRKLKKGQEMVCSDACDTEQNEQVYDGFFNRTRTCKECGTPTEFDIEKRVRYCPVGCYGGEDENIKTKHRKQDKKITNNRRSIKRIKN